VTKQLVDDLDACVGKALEALGLVVDRDWNVPAKDLTWTCWETVEHVADDLFAYAGQLSVRTPETERYVPFDLDAPRPGGPEMTIRAEPASGNRGLLRVLESCGGLLSATTRQAPDEVRGWHPYGLSDPGGFAAMGSVEVLVHVYDLATPLGFAWSPPADVVRRVLERLFPEAPTDTDPWPTLLWATGRGELPGRERLTSWRWDGSVRAPA
jgi:hypothetical protein